ncbi:flagellar basal-body rod protein FlgF [Granulosicoccaceae sp. 1_MG-2023]|nr:flagellar basal-body rod protein FlgF [Granulosicoccaceae sp. 1_MG-2023]
MDKMIYLAMSGAKETMLRQASNNHNLANLNTTGFKADLDSLSAAPVYGPGHPGRVYVQDESVGADLAGGEIITTGRALDVAVNGDGFIAVQDRDGSEGYTRAGELRVNAFGLLENGAGYPVMGNGGPIAVPPFESIEIGADGTISIKPAGADAGTLAVVDRIKLVNPDPADISKGETGLFHLADGAEAENDASVQLVSGALEGSNVNAVEAMVKMIELARQYEMQIKTMSTAEENDQAASKLLQLS